MSYKIQEQTMKLQQDEIQIFLLYLKNINQKSDNN